MTFKRPKVYLRMGSTAARMVKYAHLIKTQQQLDEITWGVADAKKLAFVAHIAPHLCFVPRELSNLDKPEEAPATS